MWPHLQAFDESLFRTINVGWASSSLDRVMSVLSDKYTWLVIGLILGLLVLLRFRARLKSVLPVLVISLAVTDSVTYQLLKPAFGRIRPCKQLTEIHLVPEYCGSDHGFPSNHAANGMAITTVLAFLWSKPAAVTALVMTFVVGLSRVYLGVHFPGDVIGGYLVGALISTSVVYLYRFFRKRRMAG